MFRSLALAGLLILPLPATAQDMPLVDHFGTAFMGFQAGYHLYSGDVLVPVKQLGPGTFEVSAEGQRTVTTTITEIEPCVFNYEAIIGTRKPQILQIYMTRLVSLSYRAGRTNADGMTIQFLEKQRDPGLVIVEGRAVESEMLFRQIDTDIPIETLEASAAALKEACPYKSTPPGSNG